MALNTCLIMNPYILGIFVPIMFSYLLRKKSVEQKQRGVPINVGGEPGYAVRNSRFTSLIESQWAGVTTLAELFEYACKNFSNKPALGTRKLVASEIEVASDGRTFEKLHLGGYEWMSYVQVYNSVCSFASGLGQLGHGKGERVAIFADTRAEWQIALQVALLSYN